MKSQRPPLCADCSFFREPGQAGSQQREITSFSKGPRSWRPFHFGVHANYPDTNMPVAPASKLLPSSVSKCLGSARSCCVLSISPPPWPFSGRLLLDYPREFSGSRVEGAGNDSNSGSKWCQDAVWGLPSVWSVQVPSEDIGLTRFCNSKVSCSLRPSWLSGRHGCFFVLFSCDIFKGKTILRYKCTYVKRQLILSKISYFYECFDPSMAL